MFVSLASILLYCPLKPFMSRTLPCSIWLSPILLFPHVPCSILSLLSGSMYSPLTSPIYLGLLYFPYAGVMRCSVYPCYPLCHILGLCVLSAPCVIAPALAYSGVEGLLNSTAFVGYACCTCWGLHKSPCSPQTCNLLNDFFLFFFHLGDK